MGNYNPHVPYLLGQEWVGIRDEDLTFSPTVNDVEVGHNFTLAQQRILDNGSFYIHDWPPGGANSNQQYALAVYARNTLDRSGPIQSVIIPCNSGGITGTGSSATGLVANLLNPADANSVLMPTNAVGGTQMELFFNTNPYNVLNGKRILAVDFLYNAYFFSTDDPTNLQLFMDVRNDANSQNHAYAASTDLSTRQSGGFIVAYDGNPPEPSAIALGSVTPFWTTASFTSGGDKQLMPWTWQTMLKFEASSANRIRVYLNATYSGSATSPNIFIGYAALRIHYCEEQRLAVTAWRVGIPTRPYVLGQNQLPTFRSPIFPHNTNPTLAAGNYTVTLASPILSETNAASKSPTLNALRELYELPHHAGYQLNIPFPVEDHLGDTLSVEQVHILPHLSLATSGASLTEVHTYGRQAVAQVYGSITATQEVLDTAVGGAATWQQVRYYARRFGNTTVPLLLDSPTITGAGMSVSLTPAEWDALNEIIDGWKDVTKRFPTAPTMGAGGPTQWRWSATGETAGNRWEVLGLTAPALSGIAGNLLNKSPQQLSLTTYGQPTVGDTVNLGWVPGYSPYVTGTTDDQTADAVLIFSQDPLEITGVTVTLQSQAITGFTECQRGPCCLPTAIQYHRVGWSSPTGTLVASDTFSRTSAGFGTNDTGQTYTDTGGTVPGDYNVSGGTGRHTLGTTNVSRMSVLTGAFRDIHERVKGSVNVMPAGASVRSAMMVRWTDANNFDVVDYRWATSGQLELVIANVAGGVQTGLTNVAVGAFQANQEWWFDLDVNGSVIRAKAWPVGTPEPVGYQVEAATSIAVGSVGLRSIRSTGNTDGGAVATYDEYTVGPSTWNFGAYELQRLDPVDATWQTIMRATDPATVIFNDYEARVGVQSSYQLRQVNLLDFAGPWSVTGTGTITGAGVTMPSCGTNKRGVLIFTTNEDQDGSGNLAYAMTWDSDVDESFDFPEVNDLSITTQLDRDYQVAFHGSERGGETFTRRLLLANAAVALPRLANMRSIRDLGWADLPYVCVRDDLGDRWLAAIIIPHGDVRRNRRLYNADITVVEVTATPSPVDP